MLGPDDLTTVVHAHCRVLTTKLGGGGGGGGGGGNDKILLLKANLRLFVNFLALSFLHMLTILFCK